MNNITAQKDAINCFDLAINGNIKSRQNIYGEECYLDKIYRCTNESASLYMPDFIKPGDKVLSVASSGDQYLNSILYGANEVELFDINANTYYFNILKIVSAKVLPKEEFIEFLVGKIKDGADKTYMHPKYYDKVKDFLPLNVKTYFDLLYYKFSDVKNHFFNLTFDDYQIPLEYSCPYLNDYNELQKRLTCKPMPKFYLGDLSHVLKRLDGKYDKMLFSNILDYVDYFIDEIAYKYGYPHLNEEGMIQLAYTWSQIKKHLDFSDYNAIEYEKFGIITKKLETYNELFKQKLDNEVLLMSPRFIRHI